MTLAATLTRPQKAAAILVAMGKPSAAKLLKFFKQEELKSLIEAARQLKTIPQAELERIVGEFEGEFAEGEGLLDSGDRMDTILNENLSPEEVRAIMGKGGPAPVDPSASVWVQIESIDPARIATFLANEHAQTAAVIMSRLPSTLGARVLLAIPKAQRGEVVKRIVGIGNVPPAALKIIENQIKQRLLADASGKDVSAGQERVASILNELPKDEVDAVMGDLAAIGGADIAAIRSRLFSFEDIVFLSQRSRVSLFDGIPTDDVTLALRGAAPDLSEAVLGALGARTRRMIESELAAGAEGVAGEAIVRARRSIAATALRLARTGVVELPSQQQAA